MSPALSMGQVTVTLNGRTYRLGCADGEEARVIELAGLVKHRTDALVEEFGQVGDDRVLLLAAMMIADELMQARAVAPGGTMGLARPPPTPAPAQGRARARNSSG